MTNWEKEANRINYQRNRETFLKVKSEEQAKLEAKQKILGPISLEIKNNYENFILPGFQILNSYNIPERLTEIRDQVVKEGEIIKRPNNFEEYRIRSEYIPCPKVIQFRFSGGFGKDSDKIVTDDRLKYIKEYDKGKPNLEKPLNSRMTILFNDNEYDTHDYSKFYETKEAIYFLICPPVLSYRPWNENCNDSVSSEGVDREDMNLSIFINGNHLCIKNGDYNTNSIDINDNNQTQITNFITQELILYCAGRKRLTKLGNGSFATEELMKHPNLLPNTKRSFLDILLGKK